LDFLVLVYKNQLTQKDYPPKLSPSIHVHEVENYSEAIRLASTQSYHLVIMITHEMAFPPSWKVNELKINNPIMFFSGVNKQLLHLLLSFIESMETMQIPDQMNAQLLESLSFIEENLYEDDLSLEKVASHIYVSRCHYSRLFQKHFGTGFKQYVMNKRIQRAKILLQRGEPVTDVCYSVGYNDLTHFGRVFKRLVGVKPSHYRQESLMKRKA